MAEHITEEEQVQALKAWWKENGIAVIAGLLMGFAALFGWRYYNDYKDEQAGEASVLYESLQQKIVLGRSDAIFSTAEKVISEYPRTPYASMAALAAAKQAVVDGNMELVRTQLQWVLDKSRQPQFIHNARLQLAAVMLNSAEHEAALALLENVKSGGYAAAYEEMKGDIFLAKGDKTAAHMAYDSALQSEGLGAQRRRIVQVKFDSSVSLTTESDAGAEK